MLCHYLTKNPPLGGLRISSGELRYPQDRTLRYLHDMAWMVLGGIGPVRSPTRIRECTMLLSAVMLGRVGAQDSPIAPDLHRVSRQADLDLAALEGSWQPKELMA